MSDTTIRVQSKGRAEHLKPHWWGEGQSGNPAGRPKGSRNKLANEFVDTLYADFQEHGKKAIETVRIDKPEVYVQIIAKLLPRDVKLEASHTLTKITHVIIDKPNETKVIDTNSPKGVVDTTTTQTTEIIELSVDGETQEELEAGGTGEVDRGICEDTL